jgi:type IV secretory pathway TraG/TraD family ATPase VirD4
MSHIAQAIAFLTDPQIVAATSSSSFSMADLTGAGKDRPTTIYLVVPWDKVDIQKTWLRLMITAGMHTFKHKPPGSKYRCLFMIDEFPALGKIDDMPRDIATMAGAGVDFALVIQGLSKLKEVYGDAQADILGNCAYKWFCSVNDNQTAEYLNKTLGSKTIRIKNKGESSGESFGGQGHRSKSEGESVSYSEKGRELLTVDEVLNLGNDVAILLTPNSRPHYLRPIEYWNLQEAFIRLREKYPDLYWPLYFDRNAALDKSKPQCDPQPPDAAVKTPAGGTSVPAKSAYDPTVYAPKNAPLPTRTAPAREQSKPSPSNYDPEYYSPRRIAERAAAKKPPADG